MTYILLQKMFISGRGMCYKPVAESSDFVNVQERLKGYVKSGCPVNDLRIVQDIPFEFKCAIKLLGEEDSE